MHETRLVLDPLFEEVADGIIVSDLVNGILYMNPAAERLLDAALADARGRALCDLLCGHLSAPGRVDCKFECPLLMEPENTHAVTFHGRFGPRAAFEWKNFRLHKIQKWKDLRVRCMEMATPLLEEWGSRKHLTIMEDVTADIAMQRQKQDWQSMLVHDLRSPLTSIFATLRFLQQAEDPSARDAAAEKKLVDISVRACKRMLELLNLYLDIAKLESGAMTVKRVRTDVGELVRQSVEDQQALARERRIAVSVDAAKGVWAVADPELLYRVVQNLLNNALKFTPQGGSVSVSSGTDAGGSPTLSIQDTGPGIDANEIPHLFDRFHQAKARREGKVQGTGLGLAFCHEALSTMNGEIAVESKLGTGSRFVIRLPAPKAEPAHAAAGHEEGGKPS